MESTLALREALFQAIVDCKGLLVTGCSEYELIKALQQPPYSLFESVKLSDSLSLFQCHFAVFNALYRLKDQWIQDHTGLLDITAMRIVLLPWQAGTEAICEADPLREYYLDWQHFSQTGAADVDEMLDTFWKNMALGNTWGVISEQDKQTACEALGLSPEQPITLAQLKRTYRKRQHQQHPDKGGSVSKAQELVHAYQLLLRTL